MDDQTDVYKFEDYIIDSRGNISRENGELIHLQPRAKELLIFLIKNQGRAVKKQEILNKIWGYNSEIGEANIAVQIGTIKKAFSPKDVIKSVTGVGYVLSQKFERFDENITGLLINNVVKPTETNIAEAIPKNDKNATNEKVAESLINEQPINKRFSRLRNFLILSLTILITLSFLIYWKRFEIISYFTEKILFEDNFSSEKINRTLWTEKGKSVVVKNGIVKLTVDETDNQGLLESNYFEFDPTKTLNVKSRVKVSYSKNVKDECYFVGNFTLRPKSSLSEDDNLQPISLTVKYANYDGKEFYPDSKYLDYREGKRPEIRVEGFYLTRKGGMPSSKASYKDGLISNRIEPIWDKWFVQKMEYEPFSGNLKYYINDELRCEFNIGKLPDDINENKLQFYISPWGWFVNHSMEIDYIRVTQ
jgi:DNA-binding winged helix-turn-helix (wHTH) protein